jgi:hypothetical protein
MRIKGIGPPTSARYAPHTNESIGLVVRNNHATEATGEGGSCCFDLGGTTYNDSAGTPRLFGYDIDKPATANLEFHMGCAEQSIAAAVGGADNFGVIQCYGFMPNALVTRIGATDPDQGDVVGIGNDDWTLQPLGTSTPAALPGQAVAFIAELEASMVLDGTGELNLAVYLRLMGSVNPTFAV